MAVERRDRKVRVYVNDLASYTRQVPEAVFAFTLDELWVLESWVPDSDLFHKDIVEAIEELEKLNKQEVDQQVGVATPE